MTQKTLNHYHLKKNFKNDLEEICHHLVEDIQPYPYKF